MNCLPFNLRLLVLPLLWSVLVPVSNAATTATWKDGNDGNWSAVNLWTTNPVVPDNSGSEIFNVILGSLYFQNRVTLDSDRTVQNLTIQGQALFGNAGTTLRVAGDLVNASGFISVPKVLVDGNFSVGTSSLQIGQNTTLVLGPASNSNISHLTLLGVVQQQGTATLTGEITPALTFPSLLENSGALTATGTAEIGSRLNNSGSIRVTSGGLTLSGGGTSSGTLTAAANATLSITNPFGDDATYDLANISGEGTVSFVGAVSTVDHYNVGGSTQIGGRAVVNFNSSAPATTGKLVLSGGTLQGSAAFHVTSSLVWRGGMLDNTGAVYLDAGATMTADGDSTDRYLTGTLVNNGQVTWAQGSVNGSGTLINNATVDVLGASSFPSVTNNSGATYHVNTLNHGVAGTFINHGNVVVDPASFFHLDKNATNDGAITVGSGATLKFQGEGATAVNETGGTISADRATVILGGDWTNRGSISLSSSLLRLAGTFDTADIGTILRDANSRVEITGAMNNTGTVFEISPGTGSFSLNGGTITGGKVRVAGGGLLEAYGPITGDVDVFGTLSAKSRLTIGGDLFLSSTSLLSLAIKSSSDQLSEAGTVQLNLDGTLSIIVDPYLMSSMTPSSKLSILKSNQTLTGQFDNVASGGRLVTADGKGSFQVDYAGQDTVVLSAFQAVPEPGSAALWLLSSGMIFGGRRRRSTRE